MVPYISISSKQVIPYLHEGFEVQYSHFQNIQSLKIVVSKLIFSNLNAEQITARIDL